MTVANSALVPRAPRATMLSTVASHCALVRRMATTCSNGWQIAHSRRAVASSAAEDVFAAGCGPGGPPRRPCGARRCAPTDAARVTTRMPAAASTRAVCGSRRIGTDYTGAGDQGGKLWLDSHGGKPVSYTHLRAHETRHDLVC